MLIRTNTARKYLLAKKIMRKQTGKEVCTMVELAKNFVGKECILYTVLNHQIVGRIKEVNENALLLENKGTLEAVNLEFIVRIREFPKNKKGKKKIVID